MSFFYILTYHIIISFFSPEYIDFLLSGLGSFYYPTVFIPDTSYLISETSLIIFSIFFIKHLFSFKQVFNFAPVFKKMDKRETIIQSAIELFGAKGFEGASVREIAAHAKVNVPLIN